MKAALADGAKPDFFCRPEDSKNSLHIASEKGFEDIVETLLQAGAAVNANCIANKSTPLHFAAAKEGNEAVVDLLLKHGAEVNRLNGFGNIPLHEAARSGGVKTIELLLTAGANVQLKNHKGSTALSFACFDEEEKKKEKGPSSSSSSSSSLRAVEIVKALIKAGSDVNSKDDQGMTPFLVTCASGRTDLMDVLVKEGADIHICDAGNRSARDIAEFYRQDKVLAKLDALFASHDRK